MGRFYLSKLLPAILIFAASLSVFLFRIDVPDHPSFDEVRYVSAARQFLRHGNGVNENWSHPPLAKMLIAAGIWMCGDQPFGWRFMSAVFGAITLVAMYSLGLALFRDQATAMVVAFLTFVNQLHFVQSRIAMLDIFMFTFMAIGLSVFAWEWTKREASLLRLSLAGACFGLAMACKWFAIVAGFACLLLWLTRQVNWQKKTLVALFAFVLVPAAAYLLAFALVIGMQRPQYAPPLVSANSQTYSLNDLIQLNAQMLSAQLKFDNPLHPYTSRWITWPWIHRPLWYDFTQWDHDKVTYNQGIFGGANPVVAWGGFAALLVCLWAWIFQKSKESSFIVVVYLTFWLSWAIIPRTTSYFYYYYPALTMLSLALPQAARSVELANWIRWSFLALALIAFVFYFPLLADIPLTKSGFDLRILFRSWI